MRSLISKSIIGVCILFLLSSDSILTAQSTSVAPLFLNMKQVKLIKEEMKAKNSSLKPLIDLFISEADSLLKMKQLSVMDKEQTPPSGDKHDFMSMGPYWWPDTTKPDSLPYIRRDGQRNPEYYKITDQLYFGQVVSAAEKLSLAYVLTNDSRYAKKAVKLLRAWFLSKKTRMNPNMNHAQFIPGINTGRGIGLIETRFMHKVLDAVCLLRSSEEWKPKDDERMTSWLNEYFVWLRTNQFGIDESNEKNNHGTWYDVQAVSLALFLGNKDTAVYILEEAKTKRISAQIEADGKQPLELARTRSWSYSTMNLTAFFHLATLGERAGVDLWKYKNANGASIRKALDYLLPFAVDKSNWKYQQISKPENEALRSLLVAAQSKIDKKKYAVWMKKIFPAGRTRTIDEMIVLY